MVNLNTMESNLTNICYDLSQLLFFLHDFFIISSLLQCAIQITEAFAAYYYRVWGENEQQLLDLLI